MRRRTLLLSLILGLGVGLAAAPVRAQGDGLPQPGARDLCPVCGMLVSKYPEWIATALYRDGHAHFFDGAKDLFKYLQEFPKYAPGHTAGDLAGLYVTEFYGLTRIDARAALFVAGSDVLGPMGHELVPLATREEAVEFLADHQGRRILSFDEITPEVIQGIEDGTLAAPQGH